MPTRAFPTNLAFVTVPSLDLNYSLWPLPPLNFIFALLQLLASYPVPTALYTNNGCPSLVYIATDPALAEAVLLQRIEVFAIDDPEDDEEEERASDGFGTTSGFVEGNIVRGCQLVKVWRKIEKTQK